ncbi:MAG: hypothetical protein GOV01_02890 [Candidatus Altiarchaeota archaeon]|nr:hypothetical protein [Candidatus Altiarchaeota archaeon]
MDAGKIRAYYAREDVSTEIARFAHNREMVGRYSSGGYSSRPGTVFFPGDVVRMGLNGIVSFHASVELWNNPLNLESDKRMGWDFLIDLDADNLDKARMAADTLIELLRAHGVNSVSIKFSGRSGFHIFVPWESFDDSLSDKFPEIPRALGLYLEEYLKEDLPKNVVSDVHIDSVAIASRHLMRAPYSLNEKSWLVSIPVKDPWFNLEDAKPENIEVKPFELGTSKGEAMSLVDLAIDFVKRREKRPVEPRHTLNLKNKVPEQFFAPCIKNILKGMSDGRKRGEFIIRSYLSNLGWSWDEIESFVFDWNKKNKPPLRDNYIKGQLRWNKRLKKKILPPNHNRDGFYKDMGVWTDECANTKNPLSYTVRKYKDYLRYAKDQERKEELTRKRAEKETKKKEKEKPKVKKEEKPKTADST